MKRILKSTTFRRSVAAVILVLAAIAYSLPQPTEANGPTVTVLDRAKIGGYSEAITFVTNGALSNYLIVLDGYDVYGIPGQAHGNTPMKKLFDLKALGIERAPRGIAYVESERLFVVHNDFPHPDTLFLFDHEGRSQGTRTIQYLNGYLPVHLEGLAYIPSSSSVFPDHLLMGVWDTGGGPSRIEVMRRDGQVVAEISPNWPSGSDNGVGGVMFLPPNRMLVTFYERSIWTIDFDGNVLAGPQTVAGAFGGEGIVQMRDGRIAYLAYPQDLLFFDGNLNRLPSEDRHDVIGLNLNLPSAIAWDSDSNKHLIAHMVPQFFGANAATKISAVPPSLDSASEVLDLADDGFFQSRDMSYLPDEHLVAIAHANSPRAILLYDNSGSFVEQVNLGVTPFGSPVAMTYIPTTMQFAVQVAGEPNKLHVFSRSGAFVRTIDLSLIGVGAIQGIAFFNPSHPSGGQFLVIDHFLTDRAVITDFNGSLLSEFNYRTALGVLQPVDVAAITTGPQAGAFSIVDREGGEIVIFCLECQATARMWIGLKNSDDVGTRFDLLAEVLKNGSVVGSGQLNNVPGGSSGFNNAVLRTIDLALPSPVNVSAGDTLSIRLSVRIAVGVSGHRSGTARLWFNDAAANSRFGATIGGTTNDYFLLNAFALGTAAGPGPKKTIDVFVDRAVGGNPFKPFGIWSKTL